MISTRNIYIAGNTDIAANALTFLVEDLCYPREHLFAVARQNDAGKHTWVKSLVFTANHLGVPVVPMEQAYPDKEALFISLEFDRIIKPERFASSQLYNIHFSKLPAYRGVGMAIWPILNGEQESAVTLHRMDAGIDSGEIVKQRVFDIKNDWTSSDLYHAFERESFELFKESILALVSGKVKSYPQPAVGASYYGPKDLDYSNLTIDFRRTAWQVSNQVRSYAFWEFQLPMVNEEEILTARITNVKSTKRPGEITERDSRHIRVSTLDYDVELDISYYRRLWEWAKGGEGTDELASLVPDVDRQDRNGWSAAILAAYNAQTDRLEWLLSHGANVNQCNLRGTTLLMYAKSGAVNTGSIATLSLVLKAGADVTAVDAAGKSVFDYLDGVPGPILDLFEPFRV